MNKGQEPVNLRAKADKTKEYHEDEENDLETTDASHPA